MRELNPDDFPPPTGVRVRPDDEVSPGYVQAMLREHPGRLVLIDCRTHEEHGIARIEGAVLIPMGELAQRLDDLRDELEGADGAHIVVHCHHGVRSLTVTHALRGAGLGPVHSMAGGIDAWSRHIDPAVPRY